MLSSELKYLLHTLGGCGAYPTIMFFIGKSVVEATTSGVVSTGTGTCQFGGEALCFSSHLAAYALATFVFAWGSAVAWYDLISGKRVPDNNGNGLSSLFRSAWLVRRNWFAVPFLALFLVAVSLKELLPWP